MNVEHATLDSWLLHLLQQTAQFFSDRHAYLVGGSVRNILLGEPCIDWDIVTSGDPPKLVRKLAEKLGGFYAHMHDKASRVVVKHDEQEIIFDIAPLYKNSIEADLRERDFTMNAIAIPFGNVVHHFETGEALAFIDPLHGIHDLEARSLKAVNNHVFQHDPLRMLRAVRFMTRYHLSIEPHTRNMLIHDARLLPTVAAERIHEELYAVLQPDGATERLRFLDEHGLFTTLLPEFIPARGMRQPDLHYWDVLDHSLETVAALERLATTLHQPAQAIQHSPLEVEDSLVTIQSLLHEAEQQGIFQYATLTTPAMKIATLLHDIGKTVTYTIDEKGVIRFYGHPQAGIPLAQQITRRLSMSTQDRRLVQQVVAHHMRPGHLSHDILTQRAVRRYFVDLGPTGILVALVSLADHLSMRGPLPLTGAWTRHLTLVRLLLTRYIREREQILPPHLVQPEELMRRLNLAPGPIIGQLLEAIAEAQAEGIIQSKDEAIWFAQEQLEQSSNT